MKEMADGDGGQRWIQQVALKNLGGEDRFVAPEEFQEVPGDGLLLARRMDRHGKGKQDRHQRNQQQRCKTGLSKMVLHVSTSMTGADIFIRVFNRRTEQRSRTLSRLS